MTLPATLTDEHVKQLQRRMRLRGSWVLVTLGLAAYMVLAPHWSTPPSVVTEPQVPRGAPIVDLDAAAPVALADSGAFLAMMRQSERLGVEPPAMSPVSASPFSGETIDGHRVLSFAALAGFSMEMPIGMQLFPEEFDTADEPLIPDYIQRLDNEKAVVTGFMVPTSIGLDGIREFLLVKDRSLCCFGRTPAPNEWASVEMMNDNRAKFVNDIPVRVFGTLHVEEERRSGRLIRIYRMEATRVQEEEMVTRGLFGN